MCLGGTGAREQHEKHDSCAKIDEFLLLGLDHWAPSSWATVFMILIKLLQKVVAFFWKSNFTEIRSCVMYSLTNSVRWSLNELHYRNSSPKTGKQTIKLKKAEQRCRIFTKFMFLLKWEGNANICSLHQLQWISISELLGFIFRINIYENF